MTVEIQTFIPGHVEPVDLDVYADIVAAIAGCGTYEQAQSLPDYFHFDNPKTGSKSTVCNTDWPRHDREGRA